MSAAAAARPASQKKRLTATERDPVRRAAWWDEATWLDPAELVFVDETSTHIGFTRLRARAPRGERVVGTAPRNHGPNVTLLAALTPDGIGASLVVEGAADGRTFEAFVARILVPILRPGQVVVLDNLTVHKGAEVCRLIEAAGCQLVFLPPYSPDFNPIELAFSQLKTALRRAAARTFATLVAAMGSALDAVTADHARGFFAHCGFPLPPLPRDQNL